jgi:hypothetical protein
VLGGLWEGLDAEQVNEEKDQGGSCSSENLDWTVADYRIRAGDPGIMDRSRRSIRMDISQMAYWN